MSALWLTGLLLTAAKPDCAPVAVRRTRPMMATYVTVTARGCDDDKLEGNIRDAFREMQRLADLMSEWNPDSPVSEVSRQAGAAPVAVPAELYEVLAAAKEASRITSGAFNVTWAALAGLWHFGGEAAAVPDSADVARKTALVGDRDLILDPVARTAFLRRSGMRIGLGGLAKGYIAEAGADLLVVRGVADVLVAASGDITARGSNGDQPWTVAIQDPRDPQRVVATVALRDESVSTAGDYEHAFFANGRRYHHILNPRTGMPAEGAASVSVLSKRGVWSDALDTGLLVMGIGPGGDTADGLPAIGALLIDDSGTIRKAGPLGDRFDSARLSVVPRADTRVSR